jgi:DNA-binding MltR family transcriptional regulator
MDAPKAPPDWMVAHNRLALAYEKESDRAVGLLATSFLAEQCKAALQRHFVDDMRLSKRLFSGYGPLASFSACIDGLFGLGHIARIVHHDLHVVRAVRNDFAHHADLIDFSSDEIRKQCDRLRLVITLRVCEPSTDARAKFLLSIALCLALIWREAGSVQRPAVPPDPRITPGDTQGAPEESSPQTASVHP